MSQRGLAAACLLASLGASLGGALAPGAAHAHLGHVIARAERYLKIDATEREARVVVSLTLGEAEGRRVLAAADADADGSVSATERDAYLAQWAAGLAEELPIFRDEERVEASWGEGYLDPIGAVRPALITVELVARVPLAGGEERVRVEDRMVRREVYDRTDVAFRAHDGADLVLSGEGASPRELTPDLSYPGDFREGEPVLLACVLRTPPRAPEVPWALLGGGLATFLLAAGIAIVVRRRRRAT